MVHNSNVQLDVSTPHDVLSSVLDFPESPSAISPLVSSDPRPLLTPEGRQTSASRDSEGITGSTPPAIADKKQEKRSVWQEGESGPRLENPSLDIRGDLEKLFESSERIFGGSYYFKKTYTDSDAPDPNLHLDGFGPLALPLTPTEAQRLISHCKRAPFGLGERTIIDTHVRDTWELDASTIHFADQADWEDFLDHVVREVSKTLGVDHRASRPRCDLYKLLVHETGSYFLPHQDTEKVDGMFASMVVVLPSQFSGGAVHLSHGSDTVVLDPSPSSSDRTSALAWYTDVTHEIKPVTSGYRLCLSFNLVHTANELRPVFAPSSSLAQKFRHVLMSWKQKEEATPFKIMYLLKHQYSQANLRGNALKGNDAQVVALLDGLGTELGFCLALANVDYRLSGKAKDGPGPDERSDEEDEVSIGSLEERVPTIKETVDLDGKRVKTGFDAWPDNQESIPADIGDEIEKGSDYEQSGSRFYGNDGGTVERWYHRTVIFLWPELHNVEIEHNREDLIKALRDVGMSASPRPTKSERRLVEYAIRAAASERLSRQIVCQSLCPAATMWSDAVLWRRTLATCQGDLGLGYLADASILEALFLLGFGEIQSTIENILTKEPSNIARLNLVDALEEWRNNGHAKDIPQSWVIQQRDGIINSLKKPISHAELQIFLDISMENSAVSFLEATIVPQVKTVAEPDFLLSFACLLHVELPVLGAGDEEHATLSKTVRDLLSVAISKADFFEMRLPKVPDGFGQRKSGAPAFVHIFFLACEKTGNEDLRSIIVDKILAGPERPEEDYWRNPPKMRVPNILLPLMPLLANTLRASPGSSPIPRIKELCHAATQAKVDTESDLICLAEAAWLSRGSGLLEEAIKPKLEALSIWHKGRLKAILDRLLNQDPTLAIHHPAGKIEMRQILGLLRAIVDSGR